MPPVIRWASEAVDVRTGETICAVCMTSGGLWACAWGDLVGSSVLPLDGAAGHDGTGCQHFSAEEEAHAAMLRRVAERWRGTSGARWWPNEEEACVYTPGDVRQWKGTGAAVLARIAPWGPPAQPS